MVFFLHIEPTEHYLEFHKREVPWEKVIEVMFSTKDPRKKGDKFEISNKGYYLLFEVKNSVAYVINAKRE